jgi:hypothetical protein
MTHHITEKCKTATFNLYKIKKIRKYLTVDSCKSLIQSLVLSHLDYMNGILYDLPDCLIMRLQRVQNMCVRTIFGLKKFDHITDHMKNLHWLPVKYRIIHKILTTVFKCVHKMAPDYLCNMIVIRNGGRYNTRSTSSPYILDIPRVKTNWGFRSFSVCGPRLWNDLPPSLRSAESLVDFKRSLKTHLFLMAYG